ncbi:hypothetical protein [Christiangramia sabulilitoris]|uniref:hypothetical protein n=1 Tax=Christiangramia sabulilitoris TaxID=2583991 RepID=UPI001AA05976|nr:hypothetical protein [Christiangramia sabulilitoris]
MEFNIAEKLAFVKAIDKVILADLKVAKGEMVYLGQLMKLLDFDSAFVEEARKFNMKQAHAILEGLSEAKKHSLAIMLHEMAYADGDMAREEIKVLFSIFEGAGIQIEDADDSFEVFDLSGVYFKSSEHIQHYKDRSISEKNREKIAIKVEPHIEGKDGYTVTTFRMNGFISFWGHRPELSPKHMEVVNVTSEKSELKGIDDIALKGKDIIPHSSYGLSIFHPGQQIEKITLYKHHKNLEIEYLK